MARNIHWKVSFRTRSERLGVLNLYEEDYAGEVVNLTPAAVPFETQEDSSDKWFVPIRKQTGYIRVLDEGNIDGIMPVGMKDRYVEYLEDDVLKWCGYMVPDVFSSDWDSDGNEVEFPVVGGLGVLEGMYLSSSKSMGIVSLATLLHECLRQTGIDYDYIYIPVEAKRDEYSDEYLYPLTLGVSRYNFFSENDSLNYEDEDWERYIGESCFNVIEEIVKLWGWTIRERGRDIWITSTESQQSVRITMNQLMILGYGGVTSEEVKITRNEFEISSLELAGADHKKDIIQGRKKVVVKASVKPVGTVVPSIDKNMMVFIGSSVTEQNNYYYKNKLYKPKSGYNDVELNSYARATTTGTFDSWRPVDQNMEALMLYVGAMFVSTERVSAEDYVKKKNWNLIDGIRINLIDWTGQAPTESESESLPILKMRSRQIANYTSGAFVISASTWARTNEFGQGDIEENGKGTIKMQFRVGDMYWDGSEWVNGKTEFPVEIGNEEDPETVTGKGKIISTKTLEQPYTGADGYVMPIDQSLSGEVELVVNALKNYGGYYMLMLENFKVEYYGVDDEEKKREDDTNRYAKTTGLNSKDEEELSLAMATNNNNKAGYGILSDKGVNVESLYFKGRGIDRPEMNLVKKGISLYKRSTEKLTLQLDVVGANPHDIFKRNGKKYALASESVNWQEETGQYIIMEV